MKLAVAASMTALLCPGGVAASGFPTGEVIEEVVCRLDADQSYALYLPSDYDAERTWPILYALDASTRGPHRGTRPVTLYRDVAERFGYIVASSNNSAANAGILFRPPDNVVAEFPQYPVTREYDELRAAFEEAAKALS